jgi:predicted CopG family antitoxin
MATTIAVSEETRRKIMQLKLEEGSRSVDELLARLLVQYRKLKLMETSELFRQRLDEAGLSVEDLVE